MRYHSPNKSTAEGDQPFSVKLDYDRTKLFVNEAIAATATVANQVDSSAPMVMLNLPVPAGFTVETGDFARLLDNGQIEKYQITPRAIIVYLRNLEPELPLTLRYQLTATMPVDIVVPPAVVYEYYDADKKATSSATRLFVEMKEEPDSI
ncbi:hypothetical protein [Bremerella alba]|uniref:Alpha-macroglobulin receptor-binding domain-containing protein n=1 Tax=Bremerella alba TaxID=980252 RepID=A0A7V8V745_9BACT|nr:hypothetical protein [Bremerella alba]MBA2116155.1 hypothetical protein [Bremerella alba]